MPGSKATEAMALLRNTAAQIRSSAEALTCRPIRTLRARPGRVSLTTSPRIVLIGSTAVACSAGASAKATVATAAPTIRNSTTRQSAPGTSSRMSPMSGGIEAISGVDERRSTTREIAKPAAAAASDSTRLSVNNWRTMRRRVAPMRQLNPNLALPRDTSGEQQVRDIGTTDDEDQAEGEEQRRGDRHRFKGALDRASARIQRQTRRRRVPGGCGRLDSCPRPAVAPRLPGATDPASTVRRW